MINGVMTKDELMRLIQEYAKNFNFVPLRKNIERIAEISCTLENLYADKIYLLEYTYGEYGDTYIEGAYKSKENAIERKEELEKEEENQDREVEPCYYFVREIAVNDN